MNRAKLDAMDSAAVDVLVPRDFMLHIKARTSEDRLYDGQNDTVIMNHGAKDLEFFKNGSRNNKVVAQVAVVRRESKGWPHI